MTMIEFALLISVLFGPVGPEPAHLQLICVTTTTGATTAVSACFRPEK